MRIYISRCDNARRCTDDWNIRKLITDRLIGPDMRNCVISYRDGCVLQDFFFGINRGDVATSDDERRLHG